MGNKVTGEQNGDRWKWNEWKFWQDHRLQRRKADGEDKVSQFMHLKRWSENVICASKEWHSILGNCKNGLTCNTRIQYLFIFHLSNIFHCRFTVALYVCRFTQAILNIEFARHPVTYLTRTGSGTGKCALYSQTSIDFPTLICHLVAWATVTWARHTLHLNTGLGGAGSKKRKKEVHPHWESKLMTVSVCHFQQLLKFWQHGTLEIKF